MRLELSNGTSVVMNFIDDAGDWELIWELAPDQYCTVLPEGTVLEVFEALYDLETPVLALLNKFQFSSIVELVDDDGNKSYSIATRIGAWHVEATSIGFATNAFKRSCGNVEAELSFDFEDEPSWSAFSNCVRAAEALFAQVDQM